MKFQYRFLFLIIVSIFLFFVYLTFFKSSKRISPPRSLSDNTVSSRKYKFIRIENDCKSEFKIYSWQQYSFQEVDKSNSQQLSKTYVYSAFLDSRFNGKLIVISVTENFSVELYCILWFSSNVSSLVTATFNVIPEGNSRRYTASLIVCQFNTSEIPLYVSVVTRKCGPILNMMPILVVPKVKKTSQIAVCVTPFNLAYNKVDQFIETMSINRMLGASHTFFYNYSTGSEVNKIIEVYKDSGVVTVLPFHLPMKVHIWPLPEGYTEEIKYFGQMASLNDCLYRTMGHYEYVVFSDMDEYLVPRKLTNWRDLIKSSPPKSNAWLFRNTFYKTEWPSDEDMMKNATIVNLHAMSLIKVLRTQTIEPAFQRSKLIVDPLFVVVIGVHNVWTFAKGGILHILPVEDGLCHHYRFWDGLGEKASVRDDNIFRLREDIVKYVQQDRQLLSHLL